MLLMQRDNPLTNFDKIMLYLRQANASYTGFVSILMLIVIAS